MGLEHLVVPGSKEGFKGGKKPHSNMGISKHSRSHQKEFPVAKAGTIT